MKGKIKYICLLLWFISLIGVFHIRHIQKKEKEKANIELKLNINKNKETTYQRASSDKKNLINIFIIIINKTVNSYEQFKTTPRRLTKVF